MMKIDFYSAAACAMLALTSCSKAPAATGLTVVTASGDAVQGVAGDAITVKVVQTMDDGSTQELPSDATVTWAGVPTVTALDPSSTADSPLPAPGDAPTAVFLVNPGRSELNESFRDVLFLLDAGKQPNGTLQLQATVSGPVSGSASVSVVVGATPAGDATRGAALYGAPGACAGCHGATGHGTDVNADGTTYTIEGTSYDYPAPGLNAESGNVAADSEWNAALFAVISRADIDNGGLTLRAPMPAWFLEANPTNKQLFTTQDYADMYAWLQTQTQ